jgi:hypothetical protein
MGDQGAADIQELQHVAKLVISLVRGKYSIAFCRALERSNILRRR